MNGWLSFYMKNEMKIEMFSSELAIKMLQFLSHMEQYVKKKIFF